MNILIIGGTGFIGPPLVTKLHQRGHNLCLFHRGRTTIELPSGVQQILGDRRQLIDYASDLRRVSPEMVIDMLPISEADIETLVNVFGGTIRRLIAISSQDVYRAYGIMNQLEQGPLQTLPINEESELRTILYPYRGLNIGLDNYEKILVEKRALSAPDIAGTVLRLPMVYGPRDYQHRLFPYIKRMLDKRPFILLGSGFAEWRWSHGYVENVADAIAWAVDNEASCGQIYNVAEPFFLTRQEWILAIAHHLDWQGQIVVRPEKDLPAGLQENIRTAQDLIVDTTKIRDELGYSEAVSLEEALARTIAWERQFPPPKIDHTLFDYTTEDAFIKDIGGLPT